MSTAYILAAAFSLDMISAFRPRRAIVRRALLLAVSFVASAVFIYSLRNTAPPTHIPVARDVPAVSRWIPKVRAPPPPLEKHTYRSDGLLEVNPNGPHPIYELIRNAEAAWDAKLQRASKTLAEAVAEYQRRYKRLPPKGFDVWWAYVQKHNVQLPDEYDQIHADLEPFWGMHPRDLQRLEREWGKHADSYTIGKTAAEDRIAILDYVITSKSGHDLKGGAYEVMELLKDVEHAIPPFRAVFSPHDNPNLHTDWELKDQALKHAAAGTYLDIDNPPPAKQHGWTAACAPTSPAARYPPNYDTPLALPLRAHKTFIHTHKPAMDPCLHPSLLQLQGQFLSHRRGPVPHRVMYPQFAYSSTKMHHDILPAMLLGWVEDLPQGAVKEWEAKREERVGWRGSNTGMLHAPGTRWREAQRVRAVLWAGIGGGASVSKGVSGNDARRVLVARGERERVGEGDEVRWARWAPAMLDVAFANKPGSCEGKTCDELAGMFEWKKAQSVQEAGEYKYLLDIDGNGWSSRFKRLVTSNSVVFKATVFPEWYTDRIAPWVHYVPIQADLSDLADALTFFRGDPNGVGAHDELARAIAGRGRAWSRAFWRKEDMTAYMFRLFLEYARVMSEERAEMGFVFEG
ncbi:hypothetical protein C0993_005630 [Termitomyces sp. T159_Od127]|nr:hypothetical protein C0993_005630 [Termitomyces sp. T159_Od127]